MERYLLDIGEVYVDKAFDMNPESPDILDLKGKVLSRKRRYTETIRFYRDALLKAPESPPLLTGLAVALRQIGDNQESIVLLKTALEIDAGYGWAASTLVNILVKSANLAEALQVALQAVKADERNALNWMLVYDTYRHTKPERLIEATEHFGDKYRLIGIDIRAEEAIERAVVCVEQTNPDDLRRAALRFAKYRQKLEVIEKMKKIIEKEPYNINAYFTLSSLYKMENPKLSLEMLEKAYDIDPTIPLLRILRIEILQILGDTKSALEILEEAKRETPEDPYVQAAEKYVKSRSALTENLPDDEIIFRTQDELIPYLMNHVSRQAGFRIEPESARKIEEKIANGKIPDMPDYPENAGITQSYTREQMTLYYMLTIGLGGKYGTEFGHWKEEDGGYRQWKSDAPIPLLATIYFMRYLVAFGVAQQILQEIAKIFAEGIPIPISKIDQIWTNHYGRMSRSFEQVKQIIMNQVLRRTRGSSADIDAEIEELEKILEKNPVDRVPVEGLTFLEGPESESFVFMSQAAGSENEPVEIKGFDNKKIRKYVDDYLDDQP
jgi:tetratricopeptide (TPR) repeat protein